MLRFILVWLVLGQIRDTTVQCTYYGYSYKQNEWYGGSTTNFYVFQTDADPLSYPIMVGYDEDWLDEWARGYVQFYLGGIPQGATIQSAGIRFYVGYIGQWNDEWDGHWAYLQLFSMENNLADWYPYSGGESSTLFNDAANGYLFVDNPFYVQMDPQYNVYYPSDSTFLPLNGTFINYLQNRINSGIDWVGIGIYKYDEEGSDAGVNFFGERTYLYVSYLMPNQPVLYDYRFYPDTGAVDSVFTFLVHFYDNYQYNPQYVELWLMRPDSIYDVFNLYLLSGYPYDGIYGARVQLSFPGQYGVQIRARSGAGIDLVYPQDGYLPGPYVIPDTLYLYGNYLTADTSNNQSFVGFGISYHSRFTRCDSVFLNIYLAESFDSQTVNYYDRIRMNLVSGDSLNGTYEAFLTLPVGHYRHYFEAYGGSHHLWYPSRGDIDGPVILYSSVKDAVDETFSYWVYDATGRLVGKVKDRKEFEKLSLRSGVYYLVPLKTKGALKPVKVLKIN